MDARRSRWVPLLLLLLGVAVALPAAPAAAAPQHRRFYTMGDGTLKIRSTKNRHRFNGRFRRKDGSYIEASLRKINRVFGARHGKAHGQIALRFIELLSHLRVRLKPRWVTISSGYRSPRYNRALRDRGGIVAKSSLHQYGMAADLRLDGVDSKKLWQHVRTHKLGGAGYYGSPWVHLDVGRPRSWTGGTAGVRKGLSDHNKRIILVPRHDIHRPGDTLYLRFARMTAWPIGVARTFVLERSAGETDDRWELVQTFTPRLGKGKRRGKGKGKGKGKACVKLTGIAQMTGIGWRLPALVGPGRYRVRATFCERSWETMPKEVSSFVFSVVP